MLISPEEYKRVFQTYIITDCVVRNPNMFTFIATKHSYTNKEIEAGKKGESNTPLGANRVIPFMRHKESDKQWSYASLTGWEKLKGGAATYPKDQFVGLSFNGCVFLTGSGEIGREDNIPEFKNGGADRGGITKLKTIGGYLYCCGGNRSVGKRTGKNNWFSHSQTLPMPSKTTQGGFTDIDGFNEQDIYTVGGKGDVWHYNGEEWHPITFFTSNDCVNTVCCGGDGFVYVSGDEGLTFIGRNNRWKKINDKGITQGFRDMVWHHDRVWCTNDDGVWTIKENKIAVASLPLEIAACAGHLYVNNGVLLLAGSGGAAFLENGQWQSILVTHDLEKQLNDESEDYGHQKGQLFVNEASTIPDETWQQALQRYEKVIKEEDCYEIMKANYENKETPEAVAELEKRLNIPLPPVLKEMYLQQGALYLGSKYEPLFEIISIKVLTLQSDRSSSKSQEDFIGLATMMSMIGEGDESYIKKDLRSYMYASLNEHYKVFGLYTLEDSCNSIFCFFDREGKFGMQEFIHDDYQSWWEDLYAKNKATLTFDQLISQLVDRFTKGIGEEEN